MASGPVGESLKLARDRLESAWRVFLTVAAFEALLTLLVTARVPSEGGPSAARLTILLAPAAVCAACTHMAFRRPLTLEQASAAPAALPLAGVVGLAAAGGLFLLRYLEPEKLLPFYERLSPVLCLVLVLSLQSIAFFRWKDHGVHPEAVSSRAAVWRLAAPVAAGLLVLAVFIAWTRIGLTPDTAYWGEPGVPILAWHGVLAVLVGFGALLAGTRNTSRSLHRVTRALIPVAIWAFAFALWMSVPTSVLQNSFYAPITPPDFQPYPYSDAGFYDYLAQSVNIGTAYLGRIPPRPLYVLFLATTHEIAGQNYRAILAMQSALLASLPVALYFLGRMVHSTAAGIAAALLAMFRETVALWVSSTTRVANSKILTTDLPTTLAVVCLTLLVLAWLQRPSRRGALILGGAFGLLLLLRTQAVMILPLLLLVVWLVFMERGRNPWPAIGLVLLAIALTLTPWLVHNYQVAGRLAFDDPAQLAIVYSQYAFTGHLDTSQFDIRSTDFFGRLLGFVVENPIYVANFVAAHFFNTLIGGLLALPLIEEFSGLQAPVNVYWTSWNGSLAWYNVVLLLVYLVLVAIGLGASWKRLRWAGLIPLAVALAYAFSNGVARFSGWRYNLPADWVVYFFAAIGAMEVLAWLMLLFGVEERRLFTPGSPQEPPGDAVSLRSSLLILALFVAAGSTPWVAKGLRSPLYVSDRAAYTDALATQGIDRQEVELFLDQRAATLEVGRLLFPRFLRRDVGLSSTHPWPAYAVREFPRLAFILLNESALQAIFPTRTPTPFPPGAETVLLACKRTDHLDVRLVWFVSTSELHQSGSLTEPCE